MSRLLVSVTPVIFALALALALGADVKDGVKDGVKDKPPEKEKLAAHVVLRAEALKEEEALQGMQTEWLLLVLKLQRRLDKQPSAGAKQEAAACAKLVNGSRDLPGLYDSAVVRLKQSSLANIAGTKSAMKATGALADALERTWDGLKKAPAGPFAANRVVAAEESALGLALLEAAADLGRAADAVRAVGIAEGTKQMSELVRKSKDASAGALRLSRQRLQALKEDNAPAAQQAFYAERLVGPVAGLVDDKERGFVAIEVTLGTLDTAVAAGKIDAGLLRKAQEELRACAEPLQEAGARIVIVHRLRELATRQRGLHERLRKHHDTMLGSLLQGIEK